MTGTIWPPDFENCTDPKYLVLVQSLRCAVRSGHLAVGEKLPPVRDLAWQLGITPGTVARAYKLAVEEGLLETTVGRGTFVADGRLEPMLGPEPLVTLSQSEDVDLRAVRVPDVGQDKAIHGAMARVLAAEPSYLLCPDSVTDLVARQAVVNWIGHDIAARLSIDDVVLTLGAQNASMIAMQCCLHGSSPVVLTEEVTFPGVRHACRLLRADVIGVGIDQDGLRPDRLEEALRRHGAQVLVTSAQAHSPTTVHTPLARRQEIAELARRYNLQIIEDDCYGLNASETPSYRMLCPDRAWYLGSLTKAVSSALRFGFLVPPEGRAQMARHVMQSNCYGVPQPMLDICAELILSGEAAAIRQKVIAAIEKRVRVAVNILGSWDIRWRRDVPFIWLKLPQGWRGSTFVRACDARGIRIKSADEYALPDGQAPNAVRIALAPELPVADLQAALEIVSELLAKPPLWNEN
ncbi:aminotransferase-like domain-containing protein [Shimia marina]|uniref:Putative HTH-type transcriptional regulator YjiR n=1 Tax=Shimia marina TaxID=321267 RepID=A0A0P1FE48_9RHOB|nr:PLP-dependent aminotransferase family protein [Shimia marina]CUH53107.1 putative HTH-type transcriptional regulator YjiR [Shimia marina]SFE42998.1 DNA-binding transcriptional regulator, MocR family, contains an aminotransferase domain [Shimia marina]